MFLPIAGEGTSARRNRGEARVASMPELDCRIAEVPALADEVACVKEDRFSSSISGSRTGFGRCGTGGADADADGVASFWPPINEPAGDGLDERVLGASGPGLPIRWVCEMVEPVDRS